MNGEIHRADPQTRRMLFRTLVGLLVFGSIAVVLLHFWLDHVAHPVYTHGRSGSGQSLRLSLALLFAIAAATTSGFAVWLRRLAKSTTLERRWPPSQLKTAQDVKVRHLTAADATATRLNLIALAFVALTFLILALAVVVIRAQT